MSLGLIGQKQGMTQIFLEDGHAQPVSVIKIEPNYVSQVKTLEKDKYQALQLTTGQAKVKHTNKPRLGHFAKANIQPGKVIGEFRITEEDIKNGFDVTQYQLGQAIDVELFKAGDKVDVSGVSIGRGFSGVIKRHNFSSQRASHGNSLSHNVPGSIGQNQSPGRVFKGKRMAGQMGNVQVTNRNLEIVAIDKDKQVMLVKGAVPGHAGSFLKIAPAKIKTKLATAA